MKIIQFEKWTSLNELLTYPIPVYTLIEVNSDNLADIESTQIGALLLLRALYERIR